MSRLHCWSSIVVSTTFQEPAGKLLERSAITFRTHPKQFSRRYVRLGSERVHQLHQVGVFREGLGQPHRPTRLFWTRDNDWFYCWRVLISQTLKSFQKQGENVVK
jgi:hypothetical protein